MEARVFFPINKYINLNKQKTRMGKVGPHRAVSDGMVISLVNFLF